MSNPNVTDQIIPQSSDRSSLPPNSPMNIKILAVPLGMATSLWLFLEMGGFFKPYFLAVGENLLFWLLWGSLWVTIAFAALLGGKRSPRK